MEHKYSSSEKGVASLDQGLERGAKLLRRKSHASPDRTCVTGPFVRARPASRSRAEGDFIVQTPILTTLALPPSLALYSVDSSTFRATVSRSPLLPNESPLQSSYSRVPIGVAGLGTRAGYAITAVPSSRLTAQNFHGRHPYPCR